MNEWIAAGIVIGAAVIAGLVIARVLRALLSGDNRPELVQRIADQVANLGFWIAVVVGLVAALGIVNETALDELPKDAVDFLPKLFAGLIVFIIGNTAATLAAGAIRTALESANASAQKYGPVAVRGVILVATVILAAAQIGLDTTIINMAAAALLFSVGLTIALLIGLGGTEVSAEVAAARALRTMFNVGDVVTVDDLKGKVVAVHSTAVELETAAGVVHLVPNSEFLASRIEIDRQSDQVE